MCLHAYIWPKSRTERPRKIKIGIGVAHVTHDSDTTFKVKRSKINLQGEGILFSDCATPDHAIVHVQYLQFSSGVTSVCVKASGQYF